MSFLHDQRLTTRHATTRCTMFADVALACDTQIYSSFCVKVFLIPISKRARSDVILDIDATVVHSFVLSPQVFMVRHRHERHHLIIIGTNLRGTSDSCRLMVRHLALRSMLSPSLSCYNSCRVSGRSLFLLHLSGCSKIRSISSRNRSGT